MDRLTNKKILIVDDAFFIRYDLMQKLKKLNSKVQIKEADSYPLALQTLKAHDFDMIFLDLDLSYGCEGKDGIEILKFIEERDIDIPLKFIVSGTVKPDKVIEAYAIGVNHILAKPIKKEALQEVLIENL